MFFEILVVSNAWLETLLTSIDFLPKDVIKREVSKYFLELLVCYQPSITTRCVVNSDGLDQVG